MIQRKQVFLQITIVLRGNKTKYSPIHRSKKYFPRMLCFDDNLQEIWWQVVKRERGTTEVATIETFGESVNSLREGYLWALHDKKGSENTQTKNSRTSIVTRSNLVQYSHSQYWDFLWDCTPKYFHFYFWLALLSIGPTCHETFWENGI